MADFLDEKQNEIAARLKELKPLVEEYRRLEAAAAALDGVNGVSAPTPATTPRRRGASQKASSAAPPRDATNGAQRRGRPKGSGTRGAEAIAIVTANPGIAIPEIAAKMGIKQNYLYRVLPGLEQEGRVRKQDRGWYPAEQAATKQ